jgi:hypothetical protein
MRARPRWSPGVPGGMAPLTPLSMTGLPGSGASVGVGPPLFWSGPSSGLSGAAVVPIWLPLLPLVIPVRPAPPMPLVTVYQDGQFPLPGRGGPRRLG